MIKLMISIGVCLLGGFVGSFFAASSIGSWYEHLKKPVLNPPAWIFAPVWTMLYIMIGVSAFLVWRRKPRGKDIRIALVLFLVQLLLNFFWSPVFFGMRSPSLSLVIIILMWQTILATIIIFYRISIPAAYLLVPYFIWVSFATYLNAGIYYLNR
ncbi:MAG: tryptophan-rich sensory protein [Candidatus Omnitrophica bacterium]|nr:tryptophan-rich sensory protein [Candidatus Omnitrophota bacterium]